MQPDMIASAVHALHLLLEPTRLMVLVLGVLITIVVAVSPWRTSRTKVTP